MATQAEAREAIIDCLKRIGQEFNISFEEFSPETFSQGGYKSDKWTYKINQQWVSLDYWFSSFSTRKEEVKTTYLTDDDEKKLTSDLRECLNRLRQFVKRKKGMF